MQYINNTFSRYLVVLGGCFVNEPRHFYNRSFPREMRGATRRGRVAFRLVRRTEVNDEVPTL